MRPLLSCFFPLSVAMTACAPPPEEPPPAPTLIIAGSESLTSSLMPRLAESFEQANAGTDVRVNPSGTGNGMRALLAGEADLAAASRPHLPAEEEQALVNGYSLAAENARHIVAVDTVVVVVPGSNPLGSITYDQVIGIFCTGELTDWADLGMEPGPIRALSRGPESGTRALFEDFFCGPAGFKPQIEEGSTGEIITTLNQDPHAISYLSMTEGGAKTLNLRPEPEAEPIAPTLNNIARGAYPLSRDLFLYAPGSPDELAQRFLDFVGSEQGQATVSAAGFVPVMARPELLDEPRPLREIVQFDEGSDVLAQRSEARLNALIEELKQKRGAINHIVLEGYASTGERDSEGLSEGRAQRVKEAIEAQIPGLFFEIIPRGETRPIAPNTTPHGRARNRRVQVYLADEEAKDLDEVRPEPKED